MKNAKMRKFIFSTMFCLAFSLVLTNCSPQYTVNWDEKTFYSKWAAWEAQGFENYSVDMYKSSSTGNPHDAYTVTVIVKNNVAVMLIRNGVEYPIDDHPEVTSKTPTKERTISNFYAYIEDSVRIDKLQNSANWTVKINYNENFHFPEYVESRPSFSYFTPPARRPIGIGLFIRRLSEFHLLESAAENQ